MQMFFLFAFFPKDGGHLVSSFCQASLKVYVLVDKRPVCAWPDKLFSEGVFCTSNNISSYSL